MIMHGLANFKSRRLRPEGHLALMRGMRSNEILVLVSVVPG